MSTDGSSDWIVPLLLFNLVAWLVLLGIGIGAYRITKQQKACQELGGVLVDARYERICVAKTAVLETKPKGNNQ